MTRARHVAPVALTVPVVVALAACAGTAGAGQPSADPGAIASRLTYAGIAPDLLLVTDLEGFTLAPQAVGVSGDEGMSAMYVRQGDDALATVLLRTSRTADPTAAPCDTLRDPAETPLRCSAEHDAVHVVLEGDGADAATLRAAAEALRVPREDELPALFAELPVPPTAPVERGDLPPHGDGAPVDEPGLGG